MTCNIIDCSPVRGRWLICTMLVMPRVKGTYSVVVIESSTCKYYHVIGSKLDCSCIMALKSEISQRGDLHHVLEIPLITEVPLKSTFRTKAREF